MDEFLSSKKFEQMARAYNAKYNSVDVLEHDKINLDKLQSIFVDIKRLLEMLDSVASSDGFFLEYFDKRNNLREFIKDFADKHSIILEKYCVSGDEKVDNKSCVSLLAKVVKSLFSLHNEQNFEIVENILNMLLDVIMAFYSGF